VRKLASGVITPTQYVVGLDGYAARRKEEVSPALPRRVRALRVLLPGTVDVGDTPPLRPAASEGDPREQTLGGSIPAEADLSGYGGTRHLPSAAHRSMDYHAWIRAG
jgi:hypothetical protein